MIVVTLAKIDRSSQGQYFTICNIKAVVSVSIMGYLVSDLTQSTKDISCVLKKTRLSEYHSTQRSAITLNETPAHLVHQHATGHLHLNILNER